MIFVTVGTHEQQFNRLVECIDKLKMYEVFEDDVFIQTGYSTYTPQYCVWEKMISYQDMQKKINEARIIITHGGPSSFMAVLRNDKVPIVVPRRREFGEHVNNHQVEYCNEYEKRKGNIIVINSIEDMKNAILDYSQLTKDVVNHMGSNNKEFCLKFKQIVDGMF